MAEAQMRLEFSGTAVAAGQMDARGVGQSLLALSDLVTLVRASTQTYEMLSRPIFASARSRRTPSTSPSFLRHSVTRGSSYAPWQAGTTSQRS